MLVGREGSSKRGRCEVTRLRCEVTRLRCEVTRLRCEMAKGGLGEVNSSVGLGVLL